MASNCSPKITKVFVPSYPMFQVYKDGRVERLRKTETVPPCGYPQLTIQSKDTPVSTLTSARIFLPQTVYPTAKISLLIYIHGGVFCIESPLSPTNQYYLTSVVNKAKLMQDGPEPCLNERADFDRVFLARDSAGANIAHKMIMKASGASLDDLIRLKFIGLLLLNPYFMNHEHDELVEFGHVDYASSDSISMWCHFNGNLV
ncbi:putative Alpha/beta-Hydrolases superfamily protein [Hibiscus syriacus]|uniref:Alpha/beta-Hydrolases superfamily protein n=1 Tax=Hibiscus syriacus TaxID=106335 RepID=A0A6A3BPT9_HIBSY|nr:putative Alpha/beta-Hydrolases superfamily protein [Hibiscus syriacus]